MVKVGPDRRVRWPATRMIQHGPYRRGQILAPICPCRLDSGITGVIITTSQAGALMTDHSATVRAKLDMSGAKPHLVIDGTILVYTSLYEINLVLAVPQGINPTICLINATVSERPSPMKGVMQPFDLTIPYQDDRWKSVQVVFHYESDNGSDGRVQSISANIAGT